MPHFDIDRANGTVELRLPSAHQIVYTLVGPQEEIGAAVPELLRNRFVRSIGDLPKSGLQLLSPSWYQYYHLQRNLAQPAHFGVIFEQNFYSHASDFFNVPALIHVLGWSGKSQAAIVALAKVNVPLVVVPMDSDVEECLLRGCVPAQHLARTTVDIFAHIERHFLATIPITREEYADRKTLNRAIAEAWRDEALPGPQLPFYPLGPNESQIRQMLGQFQPDFWLIDKDNPLDKRPIAQARAFTAVFETIGAVASSQNAPWKFNGYFPAAILAFPSIKPKMKESLLAKAGVADPGIRPEVKEFIGGLVAEQDSTTYLSFPRLTLDDPSKSTARLGLAELASYTHFLDEMGYLHGSFHCSPYIRAPVKGTSLAKHHSIFSPRHFRLDMKPGAIRRKIERFSQALRHTLHPDIHSAITRYPSGLVALSDFPIEWMEGDGIPLAFSHDLCRIPETGPTNLLSQFNRNRSSQFTIRPEILSKTLVVCGAPEDDIISKSFDILVEIWKDRDANCRWARCPSLDYLYGIVNEFRPELLIFDTHGLYQSNKIGTELQIGPELLNGENVIAHFPQVPLVLLSTCWGAPLYGSPNTIAHAFFEAGSFAVTTSMLPLNFLKGATMYSRVLNNLQSAAKIALHPNWSSFISHNIRTSYFDDLKTIIPDRYSNQFVSTQAYSEIRGSWQARTMMHGTRREAYMSVAETLLQCVNPSVRAQIRVILERKEFVPEFMFYSTLGRADLIPFAAWNKKHYVPQEKAPQMADFMSVQLGAC